MSILASILGPFSHTPFSCSLFLTFLSSVSDVFHPWQMGIRDPTLTRWIKVWRIYVHWDKQCCVSLLPVAFLGLNGLKAPRALFGGQRYLEYLVNNLFEVFTGEKALVLSLPFFALLVDLSLTISSRQTVQEVCETWICFRPFQIYTFFCLFMVMFDFSPWWITIKRLFGEDLQ